MQQQQQQMTYQNKKEVAIGLLALPALSVIVFLRRRIGFRLLDSGWYLLVAVAVYFIALFNYDPRRPFPHLMEWYALSIALMGALHRMVAWLQLRRGNQPHSYSPGVSLFFTKRTPRFMRAIAHVVVEPLVVLLVGFLVRDSFSIPMGNWLIFAAASLMFYEIFLTLSHADREMDIADGLLAAHGQGEAVQKFGGVAGSAASSGKSEPISTGLGKDIRRNISSKH